MLSRLLGLRLVPAMLLLALLSSGSNPQYVEGKRIGIGFGYAHNGIFDGTGILAPCVFT